MNNRHERRAEFSRFRRATGSALVTWLVDANDPMLHEAPPRVVRAAYRIADRATPLHLLFIAHLGPTGGGRTVVECAIVCDEC